MSRPLWFLAGAGAGVYAAFRARRAAEILTIDGLRDRVGAVVVGARLARDEIAQGRAEAETQLRERLGVRLHEAGRTALPPGTSGGEPPAIPPPDHPTGTTDRPTSNEEASP